MQQPVSIINLHLRYRLWIAEMNLDINVLRIFDDYLKELEPKKDEPDVKSRIDYFKKQFAILRKEIDELRHEMHLLKMQLASYTKKTNGVNEETLQSEQHKDLEKHYSAFRKTFDKMKDEFRQFDGG